MTDQEAQWTELLVQMKMALKPLEPPKENMATFIAGLLAMSRIYMVMEQVTPTAVERVLIENEVANSTSPGADA